MAGAGLVDPAADHELLDPIAEVGRCDPGAVATQKQRGFRRQVVKERSGFRQETIKPGGRAFAHRHHPAFAALALAHRQCPAVRIVIAEVQPGHFRPADARGIKQFQHRPVPQPEGIGRIGHGQHPRDLLAIEGLGQPSGLLARQIQIGSRIGRNHPGSTQPGKKPPHTTKTRPLRIDGQRPPATDRGSKNRKRKARKNELAVAP